MTRGTIIFIDDRYIYFMPEINGDMFPQARGLNIIVPFLMGEISSYNQMKGMYVSLLKKQYEEDLERYNNIIRMDLKEIVDDFLFMSDYFYFINNSGNDVAFTNSDGNKIIAKSKKLTISHYYKELFAIKRQDQYQVTLADKEIALFENALDFYSRLMMGQYDHLTYESRLYCYKRIPDSGFVDSIFLAIRKMTIPNYSSDCIHGSYGITCKEVDIKGRLSYEILKTIMHNRSYAEHPEGGCTVNFREPLKVSDLEFPSNETYIEGDKVISITKFKVHHLETIFEALKVYLCFLSRDFETLFSYVSDDYIALSLAKSLTDYYYLYTDFNATNAYLQSLEVHKSVINQIVGVELYRSLNG